MGAEQLMAKDALGAHARDELGISEITAAPAVQAALASAAPFQSGGHSRSAGLAVMIANAPTARVKATWITITNKGII